MNMYVLLEKLLQYSEFSDFDFKEIQESKLICQYVPFFKRFFINSLPHILTSSIFFL